MTGPPPGKEVERAVQVLCDGGLVAFPTETVYGLGADASSAAAVAKIFAVKGRPSGHPLIVHLASAAQLTDWSINPDPRVKVLAEAFWPGPLTVIVPRSGRVVDAATGGRETVGLRVPDHPLALALLAGFERGVAAPSANRFGAVSPTTAAHVRADLGSAVDLVLDGGPCRVGLESTIIELVGGELTLLRPGGVPVEAIEAVLGEAVVDARASESRASGMLASHYAPRAPVIMIDTDDVEVGPDDAVVGPVAAGPRRWPLPDDAAGYGAGLYQALRAADAVDPARILVVPPTSGSLLPAVLDRLTKAAAPR